MSVFVSFFWLTVQDYLTYRVNFIIMRLRMFLRLIIALAIWKAVFVGVAAIGQYQASDLVSYIVMIHILGASVYSGRVSDLTDLINSGNFSNSLLRPTGLIQELLGKELADKVVTFFFLPLEVILGLLLVGLPLQLSIHMSFAAIALVALSLILFFCMSLFVSLFAFWTTESWAIRFFLFILLDFSAGSFIPLDLYPSWLARIMQALPFAQLLYIPTQVFLGKHVNIPQALVTSTLWTALLCTLCVILWKRGLCKYTGEGR